MPSLNDKQPNHTRIYHTVIAGIVLAFIFAGINTYNTTTLIQSSVTKLITIQELQTQTLNDVKVILAEFRKDKKHIVFRVNSIDERVGVLEHTINR